MSETLTEKGDPVIIVMRSGSDGTTTFHVDSTRDTLGSGGWDSSRCARLVDIGDERSSPTVFGCALSAVPLTEPIVVEPLAFPAWFGNRTEAPTCGFTSRRVDDDEFTNDGEVASGERSLRCMDDAIGRGARSELVTVDVGGDFRIARWLVSLGAGPFGVERFEVAALVVDLRARTTRWVEPRCVEGELVDGRIVGDFIVARDQVDQLDPSGTVLLDDGSVLELPSPDDRGQAQLCSDAGLVDEPFVTPFEATGLRIGDVSRPEARPFGLGELGEFDITLESAWTPVGDVTVGEAVTDVVSVIGFIRSGPLDRLPIPPELGSDFTLVIYAGDGVTRIGEFIDGSPVLDS